MTKFNSIIFDYDGTLVDSSKDVAAAINYMREHYGFKVLGVNEIMSAVGYGITRLVEHIMNFEDVSMVKEARDIVIGYVKDHLLDESKTYPGIKTLLESLHGKYSLAIATNRPVELAEMSIKGLGIGEMFDLVAGPETTGKAKPSPEMLEHISSKLKTPAKKMLLIGDSTVDIETARNFGCKVCAVTWGYNAPEVLYKSEPDFAINTPMDLLNYL